jgi:hypothetical protein
MCWPAPARNEAPYRSRITPADHQPPAHRRLIRNGDLHPARVPAVTSPLVLAARNPAVLNIRISISATLTPSAGEPRLTKAPKAGFRRRRLLFVMEVSNRMHMQAYLMIKRFTMKKPNLRGTWKDRCGDNFYNQNPDGSWQQHRNRFHVGPACLAKDTRKPFVSISRKFWYFGQNAVPVPTEFVPLIGQRGIRVNHPAGMAEKFFEWVEAGFEPGIRGLPNALSPVDSSPCGADGSFCRNAENAVPVDRRGCLPHIEQGAPGARALWVRTLRWTERRLCENPSSSR